MRWLLPSALAIAIGLASPAHARSEKTLAYPREQVWPTAVRFLVVDERAKITDKDLEAGYVVFELTENQKKYRGTLELTTTVSDGRPSVKFILQVEDRPSWVEIAMLTRLERKLRAELGSPAPAPKPKPPAKDAKDTKDEPPKPDPGGPPTEGGPPISPTP